jgi:hypothetical protein
MQRRCQCLTKDGKGPQCSRNVMGEEIFCYQHQNCSHKVTPQFSPTKIELKPSQPSQPQLIPKPPIKLVSKAHPEPPHVQQKPQPIEITRERSRQRAQRCDICHDYVRIREGLQTFPQHLQNKETIIRLCDQCYQECMNSCLNVMGKENEINCRTTVCSDYYKAREYAKIDDQRMKDEARRKLAGVTATMTKMGVASPFWPAVPKK